MRKWTSVAALLTLSCFAAAVINVGCTETYNMGSTFFENFHSCALNDMNGGGGSAVIASSQFYCVKITKFYLFTFDQHVINVQLLKGTNCENWSPSDYCYTHMGTGHDCNKNVQPSMAITLGEFSPSGSISYIYTSYDNAVCSATSPYNPVATLISNSILVNGKSLSVKTTANARIASSSSPTTRRTRR